MTLSMANRFPSGGKQVIAAATLAIVLQSFFSQSGESADRAAGDIPVRGFIRAVSQTYLSTDVSMRILKLPFREGERFRAGEILVVFDCRRQRAELGSIRAQLAEAKINLETSEQLDKYKAIGRNDIAIARARVDRMVAEHNGLTARVADCEVPAPYNGRVSDVSARILEYTTAQKPFLGILNDTHLEIEMIAPSHMLAGLARKQVIRFLVDELGGPPLTATIDVIGAAVDPVSKTIKIIAGVDALDKGLLPGMSGTALFQGTAGPQ